MKPVIVIGGGISGVTAALELAEAGKEVLLVEKEAYLGGNVVRMHNYFPKLCPPACGMEINFRRMKNNPRITIKTQTRVTGIVGEKGNFTVSLTTDPSFVNDFCTACGDCSDVCPEYRDDAYNYQFSKTKAIYLSYEQAYPQKFVIDPSVCKGASCSKCVENCQYGAIQLDVQPVEENIEAHSVILATGWRNYDAGKIESLAYDLSADIVTNVEFERLLSRSGPGKGNLFRPSDGKVPGSIAFVQCAGSRDRNHLPYCSGVCCSASLKHALNAVEVSPETRVSIFYIDLRVTGRNEDFLAKVEAEKRIRLIKGKVGSVKPGKNDSRIEIVAENIADGEKIRESYDMVVLATGIVPGDGIPAVKMNEYGFFTDDQQSGIVAAGCAKRPMDVSSSVKDATSAAIASMKPVFQHTKE